MPHLSPSKGRFQAVASQAVAAMFATMVLADATMRWDFFRTLPLRTCLVFTASIIFEASVLAALVTALRRDNPRPGSLTWWVILLGTGLLYSFALVGSWGFYAYFHRLPGVFTFSYLFAEPGDFFNLLSSGTQWYTVAAIIACGVAWARVAAWTLAAQDTKRMPAGLGSVPTRKRWLTGLLSLGFLGLVLVLNRHTAISPGSALPVTDAAFGLVQAVKREISGLDSWVRLQQRLTGPRLAPLNRAAGFSGILIVNESLRRQSLDAYGYERITMPRMRERLGRYEQEGGTAVRFDHAYSNATVTSVSVPSILSGVSPVMGFDALHKSHLVYEHVKRLSKLKTGLIAAHSYVSGNYLQFVQSADLDFLWYRETEDLPAYNNVGTDDAYVPKRFEAFLDSLEDGENFFVVLHFNGTHYPYVVPPEHSIFNEGRKSDAYDNAIHYLDANIDQVFQALEQRGLSSHTWVAVTSDHGESLGETGGVFGHFGRYTEYNAGIPMLWFLPRTIGEALGPKLKILQENAAHTVSNVDIVPSILGLYEIPYEGGRLSGQSLWIPSAPERPAMTFNLTEAGVTNSFLGVFRAGMSFIIERDGTTHQITPGLYDLRQDPVSTVDLWPQQSVDEKRAWLSLLQPFPLAVEFIQGLGSL